MIQYVYSIKDEPAASYRIFGSFVNEAVACRDFKIGCDADGVPASDLMLYESGTFDTDTGVFNGYDTPKFILRGEKRA